MEGGGAWRSRAHGHGVRIALPNPRAGRYDLQTPFSNDDAGCVPTAKDDWVREARIRSRMRKRTRREPKSRSHGPYRGARLSEAPGPADFSGVPDASRVGSPGKTFTLSSEYPVRSPSGRGMALQAPSDPIAVMGGHSGLPHIAKCSRSVEPYGGNTASLRHERA